MEKLQFKCTLKSDLIINQKSASEGPNKTLDFIPGNNFLGIVAGQLYNTISQEDALKLFHSGDIRFSDAHPSINGIRSLKTPLCLYAPKLLDSELYIIFQTDVYNNNIKEKLLKQKREGFLSFTNNTSSPTQATLIRGEKKVALKSAYDSQTRRSADQQLFAYESVVYKKGVCFYFDVEFEDSAKELREKIKEALIGIKRIGRSKSAEYGSIRIEECKYSEISSTSNLIKIGDKNYATIYADSRLIFLDENGLPKLGTITAKDLGLSDKDNIVWDKTQVRIFQYAPYNNKRKSFDSDRYGFEKGCVFVVELNNSTNNIKYATQYVGNYNNEGFGRIIYNPQFLQARCDGQVNFDVSEYTPQESASTATSENSDNDSMLIKFLKREQELSNCEFAIYEAVEDYKDKFRGISNSQWGYIRSIAMQYREYDTLKNKVTDFLNRNTAGAKQWTQHRENLMDFIQPDKKVKKEYIYLKLINLANQLCK